MSFSASEPFPSLELELADEADDARMTRTSQMSRRSGKKTGSSLISENIVASDGLPNASPLHSPVRLLKHCEWKPPVIPGKSAIRKAAEKRELDKVLKTKSRVFPPPNSPGVPVGVADRIQVYSAIPMGGSAASSGEETLRANTAPLLLHDQRGGGDVFGASRRRVDNTVIEDACKRSSALLQELEDDEEEEE